jgi:hypothetical protein
MDILWHNPLSNMYGPDFLKLYIFVIVITIGLVIEVKIIYSDYKPHFQA